MPRPNFWVEPKLFASTLGSANQMRQALVIWIGTSTPALAAWYVHGDVSPGVQKRIEGSLTMTTPSASKTSQMYLF